MAAKDEHGERIRGCEVEISNLKEAQTALFARLDKFLDDLAEFKVFKGESRGKAKAYASMFLQLLQVAALLLVAYKAFS